MLNGGWNLSEDSGLCESVFRISDVQVIVSPVTKTSKNGCSPLPLFSIVNEMRA